MYGGSSIWVGNMPSTIQKMASAKESDVEVERIASFDEQVL